MVDVGGKSYALKFVYDDNEYKAESAVKVSTKLITEEGVAGHHRSPVLQPGRAGR
jgi:branched-chain amino acid transport system substrate-binding protein